jgi:uncharacterized MAPEG superfamily protein
MTIAYWCVLVAVVLPYLFTLLAKYGGSGGYSNHHPRDSLNAMTGWRKRAHGAQLNAFEAFAPFAAAVIIAQSTGATQLWVDRLAIAFIAFRILHGVCYIVDKPAMRSIMWTLGFLSVLGIFALAAL